MKAARARVVRWYLLNADETIYREDSADLEAELKRRCLQECRVSRALVTAVFAKQKSDIGRRSRGGRQPQGRNGHFRESADPWCCSGVLSERLPELQWLADRAKRPPVFYPGRCVLPGRGPAQVRVPQALVPAVDAVPRDAVPCGAGPVLVWRWPIHCQAAISHAVEQLKQLMPTRDHQHLDRAVRDGSLPSQVFINLYQEGEWHSAPWHRDIDCAWGTAIVVLEQDGAESLAVSRHPGEPDEGVEHIPMQAGTCVVLLKNVSHCLAPQRRRGDRCSLVIWL
jgi:hypothetical protein